MNPQPIVAPKNHPSLCAFGSSPGSNFEKAVVCRGRDSCLLARLFTRQRCKARFLCQYILAIGVERGRAYLLPLVITL